MARCNYELVRDFEIAKLNVLPQLRKATYKRTEELAENIRTLGLLNAIDVAPLTRDEFLAHIDYINGVWDEKIAIGDFIASDEIYYTVMAGHNRLKATQLIGDDTIDIKLHNVHTSGEITRVQWGENIYSEPSPEEKCVAVIEDYRYGLKVGWWHNKTDYRKKNAMLLSSHTINDALAFENLPRQIQNFVFDDTLSYSIGVEMGRAYPLVERYVTAKSAAGEDIQHNINEYYVFVVTRINEASGNKRKLERLRGFVNTMNDYFKPKEEVQQIMFAEFLDGANRQGREYREELRKKIKGAHDELTRAKVDKYRRFLNADSEITGLDHNDRLTFIERLHNDFMLVSMASKEGKPNNSELGK